MSCGQGRRKSLEKLVAMLERRGQRSHLLLLYQQCNLIFDAPAQEHTKMWKKGTDITSKLQICMACTQDYNGMYKRLYLFFWRAQCIPVQPPGHGGPHISLVKKRTTLNPEHPRAATSDHMQVCVEPDPFPTQKIL